MHLWFAAAVLLLSTGFWPCTGVTDVSPPSSAAIPLEHFTRYSEFENLKLSPDGQTLAATGGKYGRGSLVFFGLKDRKVISGIKAPTGLEIFDFEWVSAQRVIYFIAERQPGEAYPRRTGEILAVDRDGKNSGLIYGYRAGESNNRVSRPQVSYALPALISTLDGDDRHVLIAEYPFDQRAGGYYFNQDAKPQITRLDVYNGNKKDVGSVPLRAAQVAVDSQDQVRFAVGYNEQSKLAALWKPQPDAPWQSLELPQFRQDTIIPHTLRADGKAALVSGMREGESMRALYRVDLQSGNVAKLYQHTEVDIAELVTSLSDKIVVGVRVEPGKPEHHWLDDSAPTARIYKLLERTFPGQSIRITSKTRDGKLALVFVSSDIDPGRYYLFDLQNKKVDFLLAAKSWIDPRSMRPKEIISFKARDGLTVHGYLTRPAAAGPQPLVVLPHDGPNGLRNDWSFDAQAQLLANRGYAVLQVNFRGSSGYGKDFESAGARQWGAKMQDDLTDATRWAIESGAALSDRICIYGAGYGGYAALMGAVREPKLYRCAIGHAGVYDLELTFKTGVLPDSKLGRNYLTEVLGTDPAELRERSPVHHADRIEIPVLLVHGKSDERVDYKQAKRMKAALEANQKQLEWLALSGEGHGIYDEDTRREVYEKLLSFLEKHLAPATEATP